MGGSTTGEEIESEEKETEKSNATESAAASEKKKGAEEEEAPPVGGGWGGSAKTKKDDKEKDAPSKGPPREIISFLKPNLTVAMVDDFQAYARGKIPEQVRSIRKGQRQHPRRLLLRQSDSDGERGRES